jgi:universal stress protein A
MPIQKIACCTDFSDNAEAAFAAALEMAAKYGAKLYVIHVLPPMVNPLLSDAEYVLDYPSETSMLPKLQARLEQEFGNRIGKSLDSELVVLSGHVSSEILRYLEEKEIDLVVLGAFGFSGMGLVLFGSVAKRVAQKALCSVMIVRMREKEAEKAG